MKPSAGSARSTVAPCGIGDAGPVRDLDVRVEHGHAPSTLTPAVDRSVVAPYQSSKLRAGEQLVGLDVRARVSAITSAGRCGAGGSWFQPIAGPVKSRTYCLSNDGGDVPAAYVVGGQ